MLYTEEFFELVKAHLNPGGVVTLFVQLYESRTPAVKSEIATFFEAFPERHRLGNTYNGAGYDLVLIGQVEPTKIDVDAIEARLDSPEYAQRRAVAARDRHQLGDRPVRRPTPAQAPELKAWLADAQINRDRNLRLQYLAGLGLNLYEQAEIYAGMAKNRAYPENLFTGSPAALAALRAAIARPQ